MSCGVLAMWFDAQAALAEINAGKKRQFAPPPSATTATTATISPAGNQSVAEVAVVAVPRPQMLEFTPSASGPEIYLNYMRANGPASYGAAAVALGWGATLAWQVEAQLRAAGLLRYDNLGKAMTMLDQTSA